MSRYRIYVTHTLGTQQIKIAGAVSLTRSKSGNDYGGFWWAKKLSDFKVVRKFDSAGYAFLLSIENSAQRCEPCEIEVRRYTNTTAYQVIYSGEFGMNDCKFNLETCEIDVSSKEKNAYSCIEKNKDREYNMLSVEPIISAHLFDFNDRMANFGVQGRIEFAVLLDGNTPSGPGWFIDPGWYSPPINQVEGNDVTVWWRIYQLTGCIGDQPQPPDDVSGQYGETITWTMIEDCLDVPEGESYAKYVLGVTWNGTPIQDLGGDSGSGFSYLRMLNTINVPIPLIISEVYPWSNALQYFSDTEMLIPGATGQMYTLGLDPVNNFLSNVPNGRTMTDVLTGLVSYITEDCNYPITAIKSDFFQIDPPSGATDTHYVTGEYNYWKNPLLFQITDVMMPNSPEHANVAIISFRKLMGDLWKMFQVVWWVDTDGTDYWLRIEHISAAEDSVTLDLTGIKGFKAYSYDKTSLYSSKRFESQVQRNFDFAGLPITFNAICTEEQSEDIMLELLCADINYINGYPDDITNDAVVICSWDDGFFDRILNSVGALTGYMLPNASMSWANLHDAFHRHRQNTILGTLNGEDVTFESALRIKAQEISVKNCAFEIDAYTMAITELGTGLIQSLQTDLRTETAKIEVRL